MNGESVSCYHERNVNEMLAAVVRGRTEYHRSGGQSVKEIGSAQLLLVEDDPGLQALTAAVLKHNYRVLQAMNVAEAQAILASEAVDLILLDLGLPDEDGLVLARQIRAKSPLPPIIFLTSRDSALHKIEGLDIGGDDYVTKPFDPDELISRINAVLRRTSLHQTGVKYLGRVRVGYVEIELESRQVWNSHGELVPLTRAEFDVFLALVNANGRVLTRPVLLDAISTSPDHDASERTVDAIIAKIRRKISSSEEAEQIIVTVQGLGYRLGVVRS